MSAFFNLIINSLFPKMRNPCLSPAVKNLFPKPKNYHWTIFDKDTIDEVNFRTLNIRNRLLLELMARGGMRISEALGLKPQDIDGQKLLLHTPKSGREQEIVFIPKKLSSRLQNFIRDTSIVSKVILRHADLSTTQRYLGKVRRRGLYRQKSCLIVNIP